MNDNDLRTPSHDDYKRLMAEAYPSPKTDIKAAVMAQIAAGAEQSNKKAKILTPERRNRFVKFGSIAACFVLLVTLGFRVVPMMMKDAVVANEASVTADMAPAEALPETAAGSITSDSKTSADGGTGILFKSMRNGESGSSGTPAAEEPAESPSAYAYVLDEELDEIAPEAEAVEPWQAQRAHHLEMAANKLSCEPAESVLSGGTERFGEKGKILPAYNAAGRAAAV